jgi:hypothetical protein
MSYLTQSGTITYNGYSLQGPRNSVQLEVEPVYDSSGRYVTHSKLRFSIDGWITSDTAGGSSGGSDTATHMTQIRGAWSQAGGALVITGFGFGDVNVNTSPDNRDVNFGPKPQPLEMRNVSDKCIVIAWIIEAEIKICANGGISGIIGRMKEFVYNVRYSIKPNGCTVRTVEGHLEVFLNAAEVGGLRINETADDYRNLVEVPIPKGFYRSHPQEYKLSNDKQRLYFKVSDEEPESDNAYPPGVAFMHMESGITSDLFGQGGNFTIQEGFFTGEIQMAKPFPVSLAWERALLIMKERLVHAFNNNTSPLITYVSVSESLFERKVSFVVRYRLLSSSLDKLVSGSGMFLNLTTTKYQTYIQSMQLAWANRGVARLQHDATSELLPNSCVSNQRISIMDKVAEYHLGGSVGGIFLRCPPKDTSYLLFDNLIGIEGDSQNITITQMPTSPQTSASQTAESPVMSAARSNNYVYLGNRGKSTQKVQSTGDGKFKKRIVVRGRAYRVGFTPEIPKLSKYLGQQAGFVAKESRQEITITSYYGECPIYAGTWYHVYDVEFSSDSQFQAALSGIGLNSAVYETDSGKDPKKKTGSM